MASYSIAQNACNSYVAYAFRNNVEMIVIPPNTLSTVAYYITARTWGYGTHNQKFALFVANAQ